MGFGTVVSWGTTRLDGTRRRRVEQQAKQEERAEGRDEKNETRVKTRRTREQMMYEINERDDKQGGDTTP